MKMGDIEKGVLGHGRGRMGKIVVRLEGLKSRKKERKSRILEGFEG